MQTTKIFKIEFQDRPSLYANTGSSYSRVLIMLILTVNKNKQRIIHFKKLLVNKNTNFIIFM